MTMDPITILTYLVISHYASSIAANIYDYVIFQHNFRMVLDELMHLQNQITRLQTK